MKRPHDLLRPQDRWTRRLGCFLLYFDDGRWVWSPEVERIHGYSPGTVVPDAELALSHIHPEDYRSVADTLYDNRGMYPFSSRHRIFDARNHMRDVMMIGAPFYDHHGAPMGLQGLCFDMTCTDSAPTSAPSDYDEVAARLRRNAEDGHAGERARRVRAATRC
jgi:PAS domain-containing protein